MPGSPVSLEPTPRRPSIHCTMQCLWSWRVLIQPLIRHPVGTRYFISTKAGLTSQSQGVGPEHKAGRITYLQGRVRNTQRKAIDLPSAAALLLKGAQQLNPEAWNSI